MFLQSGSHSTQCPQTGRGGVRLGLWLALAAVGACTDSPGSGGAADLSIPAPADQAAPAAPLLIAGRGADAVRLGDPLDKIRAAFGAPVCLPDPTCGTPQGYGLVTFPAVGLGALFVTDAATLDSTAVLLSLSSQDARVAAQAADPQRRVRVGMTAAEARAALGPADETAGTLQSYAAGLALTVGADGKVASVSVFPPYLSQQAPPEMVTAQDPPAVTPGTGAWGGYKLDGEEVDVVDPHLHPGSFGALGAGLKTTLPTSVPPFLLPILPAFTNAITDPYAPGIGMVAQARRFGFNHLVLLSVWAPRTVGWYTNSDLSKLLYDARNVRRPDGRPVAWGLASILWDNLDNAALLQQRCAALESFLIKQGERLIGIKLAHPHQNVTMDNPATECVYALASKYKKPVALHTGKTPTPGALDELLAYDPKYLEAMIKKYPDATFVLLHVGQGDRRATNDALDLADRYKNVALELSALARPMLINEKGEMVMTMEPQFPYVLSEIKRRGLQARTMWGSDGPQSPGFAAGYRDKLVAEMQTQGYAKADIKAILAGNFYRLYKL